MDKKEQIIAKTEEKIWDFLVNLPDSQRQVEICMHNLAVEIFAIISSRRSLILPRSARNAPPRLRQ